MVWTPALVLFIAAAVVSLGALCFLVLAIVTVARHRQASAPTGQALPSLCVLKPLCGEEPMLEAALSSFLAQDYGGTVRFVFGVRDAADPAAAIVERLAALYPGRDVELVVDARVRGANLKVSNLINMARGATEAVIVVSDSDVFAGPGALSGLVAPLSDPAVGASTCLYRGRPAKPSSLTGQLGALYLDGWFAPAALVHAGLDSPEVCYGPLTAIRREVLDRNGGFAVLADCLADDTELGRLTRRQGLRVAIAATVVDTVVAETRLPDLLRHELRWAKTIRALQPTGYLASVVMHPGPIPWLLPLLRPGALTWSLCIALVVLRGVLLLLLRRRLGRAPGVSAAALLLLPLREQLYFGVWVLGFFGREVTWRGRRLEIRADRSGSGGSPPMIRVPHEA